MYNTKNVIEHGPLDPHVQPIKTNIRDSHNLIHAYYNGGSPVGAVSLALRAVNEVKLDRARLVLGWVIRLTVSNGLWLWADQLRP